MPPGQLECGCVLLVDDDPQVREFSAQFLRLAGFQVVTASSGEQAIEVFEARSSEIKLLLTDIVMPGIFGDQLAQALLEKQPDLPVIFMSGNPPQSLETAIPIEPGRNFLQKPFLMHELMACLKLHLVPAK